MKSIRANSLAPHFMTTMVATLFVALFQINPANAQTCALGSIHPSNPSSVYVVDSTNGLVTDTRTGLMWERCLTGLSGATCAGTVYTTTWVGALNLAVSYNSSSYKGYTDWRVPNLKELRSLVEECRVSPAINDVVFPNTPTGGVWSVSPDVNNLNNSLIVYFHTGESGLGLRTDSLPIRMVRGGH